MRSPSSSETIPFEARDTRSRVSGTFPSDESEAYQDDADPTLLDRHPASIAAPSVTDRYEFRGVLGEGGMGEVRLVFDRSIGREVAMKVLLPHRSKDHQRERFMREALIQGYLEHPGVVPVHDVGTLPSGEPYFTMKRVRGVTLHEVLEGKRQGDERLMSRFGQRRLLHCLSQACLAVDFAHARGLVHRDVKPENIMLGDFGEVYVLDWGVARLVGTQVQRLPAALLAGSWRAKSEILGTPGYMSPEQIDDCDDVDQPSDVYALGAILFEVLTGEPLHTGSRVGELVASTRKGADARTSRRAPERGISPELEALCVRATLTMPNRRPSARELHEALESFLDGARESERRKMVADLHVRAARSAAEGDTKSIAARRQALMSYSRALVSDPSNPDAVQGIVALLRDPIDSLPPEAESATRRDDAKQAAFASRAIRLARLTTVLYVPLLLWLGIRDWTVFSLSLACLLSAALVSWVVDSRGKPTQARRTFVGVVAMLSLVPVSTIFGSIVALPLLLATALPSFLAHLGRTGRIVTTAAACVAAGGAYALDWAGVLPQSLVVSDGVISILPVMVNLPEIPTRVVLGVLQVAPLITGAFLYSRLRGELEEARKRLHGQLWQLQQLVPSAPTEERASLPPRAE